MSDTETITTAVAAVAEKPVKKSVPFGWRPAKFSISIYLGERQWMKKVLGISNGLFGIHEIKSRPGAFAVTQLASGWKCLNWNSQSVAIWAADHYTRKYRADFARIRVDEKTRAAELFGLNEKFLKDEFLLDLYRKSGIVEKELYE